MSKFRPLLLATALVAAPLAGLTASTAAPAAPAAVQSEHDKLFALFAKADEDNLKRNPLSALFRGDMRYADRLGDFFTKAANWPRGAALSMVMLVVTLILVAIAARLVNVRRLLG